MADGFDEDWLQKHQARMAGLKAHAVATPAPSATTESRAKAGVDGPRVSKASSHSLPDGRQSIGGVAACGPELVSRQPRADADEERRNNLGVTGGERPAPKRKRRTPEQDFQKDCVKFLNAALPPSWRVVHIPNGGTTGGHKAKIVGGIRKAMGVREGFPDLMLVGPGRSVAIELKAAGRRGKVLSTAQEEWRDWFASVGLPWFLARSVEDVIAACHDAGVPLRVRL